MLSILVGEFYVGVEILSRFFDDPAWFLILLTATLVIYSGIRGLSAVLITDTWQLRMIMLGLIALATGLGFALTLGETDVDLGVLLEEPVVVMPPALWVNMLAVNLCFTVSLLRTWQIIAAAQSLEHARIGVTKSLWVMVIVSVFAIATALLAYPDPLSSTPPRLDSLLSFLVAESGKTAVITVPLFVLGLLAAMLSTIDSALNPIVQTIVLQQHKRAEEWRRRRPIIWTFLIMGVASLGYLTVFRYFGTTLINWVFTVFAFVVVITPVIILSICGKSRYLQTNICQNSAVLGILTGLVVGIIWTILYNGHQSMLPWNPPLALGVSTLISFSGYFAVSGSLGSSVRGH